jgi:hypothetical protein
MRLLPVAAVLLLLLLICRPQGVEAKRAGKAKKGKSKVRHLDHDGVFALRRYILMTVMQRASRLSRLLDQALVHGSTLVDLTFNVINLSAGSAVRLRGPRRPR